MIFDEQALKQIMRQIDETIQTGEIAAVIAELVFDGRRGLYVPFAYPTPVVLASKNADAVIDALHGITLQSLSLSDDFFGIVRVYVLLQPAIAAGETIATILQIVYVELLDAQRFPVGDFDNTSTVNIPF